MAHAAKDTHERNPMKEADLYRLHRDAYKELNFIHLALERAKVNLPLSQDDEMMLVKLERWLAASRAHLCFLLGETTVPNDEGERRYLELSKYQFFCGNEQEDKVLVEATLERVINPLRRGERVYRIDLLTSLACAIEIGATTAKHAIVPPRSGEGLPASGTPVTWQHTPLVPEEDD